MENKTAEQEIKEMINVKNFLLSEGCLLGNGGQFIYCSGNGKHLINLSDLVTIYASLHCADKQREIEELRSVLRQAEFALTNGVYIDAAIQVIKQALNPSPVK